MRFRGLPSLEEVRAEIQRREASRTRQDDERAVFVRTYHDDPARFIQDCYLWREGEAPTAYQLGAAGELAQYFRECWRSPHAAGKTALAAQIIHWFALTRDLAGEAWKLPTTASVWRQLEHYLWPEVHKWAKKLNWLRIGRDPYRPGAELLSLQLKLSHGAAFAMASDDPTAMEGAHEDQMLIVFDEAKAILDRTWDALEGAFSGVATTYALAISTPGEPTGRFFAIQSRKSGYEDWHVRHVTSEEMIVAGRQDPKWVEQRRRQWGETSSVFQNRVLGNFAAQDSASVIPLAWVELAHERWHAWRAGLLAESVVPLDTIGLDVARTGADRTPAALRSGWTITEFRYPSDQISTMETTGMMTGLLQQAPGCLAIVDVIGIGSGVVDRLRELNFQVLAFNAAARAMIGEEEAKDRTGELGFVNLRSAAWWYMRELLDPDRMDPIPIALPPPEQPGGEELVGELTAPRWRVVSGGKIEVEPKDRLLPAEGDDQANRQTLRQRLGRSTDHADAVIMAFADRFRETSGERARLWGSTLQGV